MNLLEIKKIANIDRIDEARGILNDCQSIEDVVLIINARKRERFATTLVAVYCYDCITYAVGEEHALKLIKSKKYVMHNIDPQWDALVKNDMKPIVGGYHTTVSKVWALIKHLRKEQGE